MSDALIEAFERVSASRPGKEAIASEHGSVSYGDLLEASHAWAEKLIACGVRPGSVVGLCIPASAEYIGAVLGVLRAHAVFLPVGLGLPPERIARVLDSARPAAFVCRSADSHLAATILAGAKSAEGRPLLSLSWNGTSTSPRAIIHEEARPPGEPLADPPSLPADACYIISTSGSTGAPKLIVGSQVGLAHFIRWEIAELGIDDTVRGTMLSAPTFDVSLRDILVPLLAGGTVCIPDSDTRTNGRSLLQWMRRSRVTLAHMVPTVLRLLAGSAGADRPRESALPDMRHLLMAGEPLYGADLAAWRALAGDSAELVNLYGPSETTLAKLFFRVGNREFPPEEMIPLGRPIPETQATVMRDGHACPAGEIGELHLTTRYCSHGYLNQPTETESVFSPAPPRPGLVVTTYRTGDLARLREDGVVIFEGRTDRQVKVRGNRVEIGEIEVALRQHTDVADAAVDHRPGRDRATRLHAYVVGRPTARPNVAALRSFLSARLPDYMVPSTFTILDALPRTHSGKVDRNALPDPSRTRPELAQNFCPPQTSAEVEVARLWSEHLDLETVGVNDSFFDLGGSSVLAAEVAAKIESRFGITGAHLLLFQFPTVRSLAARLQSSTAAAPDLAKLRERADQRRNLHAARARSTPRNTP